MSSGNENQQSWSSSSSQPKSNGPSESRDLEIKQSAEVNIDHKHNGSEGIRGIGDRSPGRKKTAIDEWKRKSIEKDMRGGSRSSESATAAAAPKSLDASATLRLSIDASKSVDLSHLKFKLTPSQQSLFKEYFTSTEDPSNNSTIKRSYEADGKGDSRKSQTARSSYEDFKIEKLRTNASARIKSLDNLSRGVAKIQDSEEPRIRDKTKEYLLFEEAEECTFKPQMHAYHNSENRQGDGEKKKPKDIRIKEWLSVVENKERTRSNLLQKTIGERDYKARIDKKWCPSCKKTQTYDEFSENKKKCSECKIAFRHKTVVTYEKLNQFFANQSDLYEKSQKKLEEMKEEILFNERATEVKLFDSDLKKTVSVKKNLMDRKVAWNEEKKEELSERLEEDRLRRQEELKKIEDEAYGNLTFRPLISSKKSSEEDADNSSGAFMERLEADFERRKERGLVKQKFEPKNEARWRFGKNETKSGKVKTSETNEEP